MVVTSIEPLSVDAVPAAGVMLARAFVDDPFFAYMDPDPTTRFDRVRWYLQAHTHACVLLGSAYVTAGDIRGIALWIPRGQAYGPEIERASGLADRPAVFGPEVEARMAALGRAFSGAVHEVAPEPHHYLSILGVDPDHQGQGIGGALLRPMLQRADHEGAVCYLETTRPQNVPFYERHGFVAGTKRHAESIQFWPFRRDPAGTIMSTSTP